MRRNLLIVVFALLILGGGWFVFFTKEKTKNTEPRSNISDARGEAAPSETPFSSEETMTANYPDENLSTKATFPKLILAHHPTEEARANDVLRSVAMREIENFRTEIKSDKSDIASPQGGGNDITIGFETLLLSPTLVSFRYNVSTYAEGAPHPNSYAIVLNYNIPKHVVLTGADLFRGDANWLGFLASTTATKLIASCDDCDEFGRDMIKTGTAPTKENFARVGVKEGGLVVIFNPYQVAPYARGSQDVFIPFTEIADILHPDIRIFLEQKGSDEI